MEMIKLSVVMTTNIAGKLAHTDNSLIVRYWYWYSRV